MICSESIEDIFFLRTNFSFFFYQTSYLLLLFYLPIKNVKPSASPPSYALPVIFVRTLI